MTEAIVRSFRPWIGLVAMAELFKLDFDRSSRCHDCDPPCFMSPSLMSVYFLSCDIDEHQFLFLDFSEMYRFAICNLILLIRLETFFFFPTQFSYCELRCVVLYVLPFNILLTLLYSSILC